MQDKCKGVKEFFRPKCVQSFICYSLVVYFRKPSYGSILKRLSDIGLFQLEN